MRWFRFVCLWFNQTKTTEPITMKFCTKMPYIPGSVVGVIPIMAAFLVNLVRFMAKFFIKITML